jgi:hypothetical protein
VSAGGDASAGIASPLDAAAELLDLEPAGPPPKRGRGRPPKDRTAEPTAPKRGRPDNHAQRAARVAKFYEQIGTTCALAGLYNARAGAVGMAMVDNADQLGEAWSSWADTSPRIARLIDSMSFGGGMIAVLIAHAPLMMAAVGPLDAETADGFGGLGALFGSLLRTEPEPPGAGAEPPPEPEPVVIV